MAQIEDVIERLTLDRNRWRDALYVEHDAVCNSTHRLYPDTVACLEASRRRWQELIARVQEAEKDKALRDCEQCGGWHRTEEH